jgi:hypothetical protein
MPGRRAPEPSLELLGAYGQSVSTVIAVFGLFVTAGAALVGLYAFVVAASAPSEDAFDFGREFSRLLQAEAWTKVGGEVVRWRDVLLVQIAVAGLALLALTSSALATLLHARQGRVGAAHRAHAVVFGAAYVMLAALISIPCIALASGYPDGRRGVFWLGFAVLWMLIMLSGLPFGPEVPVGARAHLRAVLWAVVGVTVSVAWLNGEIDARTALTVLLVSGLAGLLMRGASALGVLRARLNPAINPRIMRRVEAPPPERARHWLPSQRSSRHVD